MAGIGFRLRDLSRQESLTSVVAAFGHASVIAAGPWLFTILSLAGVSLLSERIVGLGTLATFRVVVIYAFSASLVLTAPITIVAMRLVADALWLKRTEEVPKILLGAFISAAAIVAVGVGVLVGYFGLQAALGLPLPLE